MGGVIFIQPPQRCSRRWWESYHIHLPSRYFSCGSFWFSVLFCFVWGYFLFWLLGGDFDKLVLSVLVFTSPFKAFTSLPWSPQPMA